MKFYQNVCLFLVILHSILEITSVEIAGNDKSDQFLRPISYKTSKSNPSTSRFFYWIHPNFNITFFLVLIPWIVLPLAWFWVKMIYPPGKFYAFVPLNQQPSATVFNATEGLFRRL